MGGGGSVADEAGRAVVARQMARPASRQRLTLERLPRYAPGLDDIGRSWRDPERLCLAHRAFGDADELDAAVRHAITAPT